MTHARLLALISVLQWQTVNAVTRVRKALSATLTVKVVSKTRLIAMDLIAVMASIMTAMARSTKTPCRRVSSAVKAFAQEMVVDAVSTVTGWMTVSQGCLSKAPTAAMAETRTVMVNPTKTSRQKTQSVVTAFVRHAARPRV